MSNRVRLSFPQTSLKLKGVQSQSGSNFKQQMHVRTSQFDEVRAKFRQIGRGKQTITIRQPLFAGNAVVVKREPPKKKENKDGGEVR